MGVRRAGLPRAGLPVALVLVGLLAACTGQGGPEPSASPSTTVPADPVETSTETATPDETIEPVERELPEKPSRPDAMDQEGPIGAEAAAGYFLDLYGYAIQTGDLDEFEEMSAEGCEFCWSVIESTRELYDRGGWIEGGELSFSRGLVPDDFSDPTKLDVIFDVVEEPHRYIKSTAHPATEISGATGRTQVFLMFGGGTWQVVDVVGDF